MKLAPAQTPEPERSPLADIISQGTVVDVPAVLLGYQQRWAGIRAPLKVGEKSRRIGLTWAEAADNVLVAASSTRAGGMNVYYLGYNQDMTVEYIQACAMWARAFNYAAGEIEQGIWEDEDPDKHIKTFTIAFPSGYRIVALTSRPSNLRGRQGVVVIDEAAFHPDLAELLKAALALLIWGGEVHVISTHNGTDNPFNELIDEIRSGKRKGELFRCTFREAVEDGLYKRVCLRKGIPYDAANEAEWVADVYGFYGDAANENWIASPAKVAAPTFRCRSWRSAAEPVCQCCAWPTPWATSLRMSSYAWRTAGHGVSANLRRFWHSCPAPSGVSTAWTSPAVATSR
ncbi:hypothetical protein [Pseudomonas nitroreducens]|uniref:hypothetical protein n=1 Tax=Pseudomonas nitroreducens TaxID=46680 RepID=UPI0004AF0361